MIDAFTAVCGQHPTCYAKNVFGFCVFLRRQSKSEEAALSSRALSPLHLSEPVRKQKVVVCHLWLADFDPFCLFLCFKLSCFVFEKHRTFYLGSKIFLISLH